MKWFKRLQDKWQVSAWQVIIILLVFALTGTTVVRLQKYFFWMFDFGEATPNWLKTTLYLLIVFPLYQVLLLFYAFCFGQFSFFWNKFKRLGRAIKGLFVKKQRKSSKEI